MFPVARLTGALIFSSKGQRSKSPDAKISRKWRTIPCHCLRASQWQNIERRIGVAAGIVRNLDKIWNARDVTEGTKVMLYHTLVQAIVLYNAETQTLKEKHKRKLRVFEMSVLRRICGITRRDRRHNVDTKQELDINLDIVERLQRRKLTHFGHVTRNEQR